MTRFIQKFTPIVLFAIGTLAMCFDLTVPSFWQDEAATLSGANRPINTLLEMAKNIDVVHAFYYGFMHFWTQAFGFSVLSMRLPSVFAVGLTSALIYLVVRKLKGNFSIAVWASLLYLAIPRTHFASGESRSNALTATLAVALTLVMLSVVEAKKRKNLAWLGYAALAALSTYDFMFSFLLAAPHALFIITRHREQIFRFVASWFLGIGLAVPVIYWGYKEKNQVSWIKLKPLGDYLFESVFSVNFLNQIWLAAAFLTLIALAILGYLRAQPARHNMAAESLYELSLAWAVLPPTLLIIASFALHPYFVQHYLTFTTPATATLASLGMHKLKPYLSTMAMGVLILVLGFFSLQEARSPRSHGPVWMPVINEIAAQTKPGDAFLLPDWRTRNSAEIQLMLDAYQVNYLPGRTDLKLITPTSRSIELFGIHCKERFAPEPRVLPSRIALVSDVVDPIAPIDQVPEWMASKYKVTKIRAFESATVSYFDLTQ